MKVTMNNLERKKIKGKYRSKFAKKKKKKKEKKKKILKKKKKKKMGREGFGLIVLILRK